MHHGSSSTIPFSRPFPTPSALDNLAAVLGSDHAHGDGPFTSSATAKLGAITGGGRALLTTSCTHALEMAVALLGIGIGDEVIVPTFTFPSAGDAVARTGARLVFVDLDPRTGNIDPEQAVQAIGPRTKAIVVMHYGGMPVELAPIESAAAERGIPIIEDNAHGLGVTDADGRHLGRIGAFGAQSFHDTKNVHCGEGGALLVNDATLFERAEIMREKGTNRSQFLRGAIDKYSWVDWGSSYLPSELNAAVLDAQLDSFDEIQGKRTAIWEAYRERLALWTDLIGATLMDPPGGIHASHLFYLLLQQAEQQEQLIAHLRRAGVVATFHYVPLGTSAAGLRYGRQVATLHRAEDFSRRLVRLPLWAGMTDAQVERVIDAVAAWRPSRAAA